VEKPTTMVRWYAAYTIYVYACTNGLAMAAPDGRLPRRIKIIGNG
jgi:hypothetical protein